MSEKSAPNLPKISVVIPAYNEETLLPYCLKSVKDQDYPGEYEIIVVDNASTDKTAKIAKDFSAQVYNETRQGVVFARIKGFSEANGVIIVSTDADTVVPRNWLSMIEKEFRNPKISGVVGAYKLNNLNSFNKRFMQYLVPVFRTIDRIMGGHFPGANFAVLKSAYNEVGGFDTRFTTGEDLHLSNQLRRHGFKLKIAYYIKVSTSSRRLDNGLWNTLSEYGFKNYSSLTLFDKPYLKTLPIVREKSEDIKEIINS